MIKPASRTDGLVLQEKRGPAGFVVRPLNSDAAGHGYDRGAGSPQWFPVPVRREEGDRIKCVSRLHGSSDCSIGRSKSE